MDKSALQDKWECLKREAAISSYVRKINKIQSFFSSDVMPALGGRWEPCRLLGQADDCAGGFVGSASGAGNRAKQGKTEGSKGNVGAGVILSSCR